MKRKLHSVTTLSVFGALLGCAQIAPPSQPVQVGAVSSQSTGIPVKVASGQPAAKGASDAEGLFSFGRYAHGAGHLAQAARYYAQALELDPNHVGALNALAVIHAQSDRSDEALRLFNRALQLSPMTAYLHNNMGYALMRAGRMDEAGARLRAAQALDPGNQRTAENIALLEKEISRSNLLEVRLASEPVKATGAPDAQLVAISPNVFELRLTSAPSASSVGVAAAATGEALPLVARKGANAGGHMATRGAAPSVGGQSVAGMASGSPIGIEAVSSLKGVRLEVSNGAGVAHLARRTADRLAPTGVVTARLTNARPYRQVRTEIQYLAGQEVSAQALQARLPVKTSAVASNGLHRGVQIRLVLGHDVAGKAVASWLDSEAGRMAQLQPMGGWLLA